MKIIFFLLLPVLLLGGFLLRYDRAEETKPTTRVVSLNERTYVPVTISTFNSDRQVVQESFQRPPERVIAVWQSSIETLLALGVGDRIIAALGLPDEKYLREEYRKAYRKIPYKSFNLLNRETALQMQPDFILTCWESSLSNRALGRTDFWRERGVNTYISEMPPQVIKYRTIEQEYRFIRDIGKIFAVEERAERLIADIQQNIDSVTAKTASRKQKESVMIIQFMGNRIKNWGDVSLQADIVKQLQGNLLMPEDSFISYEDIIAADPDVIFVMANEWEYGDLEAVRQKVTGFLPLNSLRSVKQNRVYILPLYSANYSATRLEEGIRMAAQGLYPELYGEHQ